MLTHSTILLCLSDFGTVDTLHREIVYSPASVTDLTDHLLFSVPQPHYLPDQYFAGYAFSQVTTRAI